MAKNLLSNQMDTLDKIDWATEKKSKLLGY